MQTFTSKRDSWLTVVIGGTVLVLLWALVGCVTHGSWLLSILLFVFTGGIGWIYFGTRYTVSDTTLVVRSGPLRWNIELNSITALTPTDDPTSAPACSLDRIEIRYSNGETILVSPLDKEGFCYAVTARSGIAQPLSSAG